MKYYAIINDAQVGPMELPELVEAGLMPETYVWCKGMADWAQAREVADICRFFRQRIFDLMHPSSSSAANGGTTPPTPEFRLMDDEDYKGLKRRDFYNAVGQQVAQTAKDPDEEKLEQGMPPATLPAWLIILSIVLFFPLGISALLKSRKAQKLWAAGLEAQSHETARNARMYAGVAVCLGVVIVSALVRLYLKYS